MNSNWISYFVFTFGAIAGSWFLYKSWQKPDNVIWVGVSADYKPFAFKEKADLKGFDIDLVRHIGEKLGKMVVFKEYDFPSLITSLRSGKLDFVVSGISPTEKREAAVDFSRPYFRDKFCVVSRLKDISSLSDLQNMKLGVQLGSLVEEFASKWCPIYNIKLIAYNLNTQILQTVKSGHLDGMFIGYQEGQAIAKEDPNLNILELPTEDGAYEELAIALPLNSPLTSTINEILTTCEQEGVFANLKQAYEMKE